LLVGTPGMAINLSGMLATSGTDLRR
jgi:hypothetical protein